MFLKTLSRALAALALIAGLALADAPMTEPVNINTADAETLAEGLDGVGLAKAEAIISYRDEHGPFSDIYELINVRGIGESVLEKNETRLRVSESP